MTTVQDWDVRVTLSGRGIQKWLRKNMTHGANGVNFGSLYLVAARIDLTGSVDFRLCGRGAVHDAVSAALHATRAVTELPNQELLRECSLCITVDTHIGSSW